MIVDLADLEGIEKKFEFSIPADNLDLETDTVRLKGDIDVSVNIEKSIAKTNISGTIGVAAELECTRCLVPIDKQLAFNFDVSFVNSEQLVQEAIAELNEADLDVDLLKGDEIDVKEVVREQILLNLPEQIFCKEDCSGLCEKCGENLNLIHCNCADEEADPRWAALKSLK